MNLWFIWSGLVVLMLGIQPSLGSQFDEANTTTFKVNSHLMPYDSHYIELKSGARIHYLDEGEGPVLLLLHGNPTWSFLYRHLIAQLHNHYRLVVPDYPGFGRSSAPPNYAFTAEEQAESMIRFVQAMDLTGITIMVQDWGGPVGFAIAQSEPDRVHGFVIGNTWAWPLERAGQKMFSVLMGGWPGQFAAWCCNGVVRFFMSHGMVTELTEAELEMYLAPFGDRQKRTPTHVFPAQLIDSAPFLQRIYEGMSRLADYPALITWGLEDFAFQEPERRRLEQLFPRHETLLLKRAGHFIQEDAPGEIAQAIRNWYPKTTSVEGR